MRTVILLVFTPVFSGLLPEWFIHPGLGWFAYVYSNHPHHHLFFSMFQLCLQWRCHKVCWYIYIYIFALYKCLLATLLKLSLTPQLCNQEGSEWIETPWHVCAYVYLLPYIYIYMYLICVRRCAFKTRNPSGDHKNEQSTMLIYPLIGWLVLTCTPHINGIYAQLHFYLAAHT